MAELKHTFVKGRMNKDLDERLIPNGEYRDALNIQISSSEGSDAGAIENVLGNEKVFDLGLTNATCIGTAKDTLNKKIYWFVTSEELNGIYEYDIVNNIIDPILIDLKTFTEVTINGLRIDPSDDGLILRGMSLDEREDIFFNFKQDSPVYDQSLKQSTQALCRNSIKISSVLPPLEFNVPKNTIITTPQNATSNSLILNNVPYTGEIQAGVTFTFEYFKESVLNFDSKYFILGANIIDGLLFFTDGLNEPKVIDIEKFKHYSNNLKQADGTILKQNTIIRLYDGSTRNILEEDICVAKKAPQKSPELRMSTTLRDNVVVSSGTFNFYKDGALVLPSNENPTITAGQNLYPAVGWKEGDIIIFDFKNNDKTYEATLKINSIVSTTTVFQVISYSEQPENIDYSVTATLRENDPIYELKFPRFAYRWKYLDNTYSTFSPFSMPAFIPGEFEYDGKKGFNEGLVNNLRRLTLLNIDKGNDTVKSIDILLKFDDDNNVYIVDTKKRKDVEGANLSFEITKETIKSTVPNIQLLRQWDNVPKKALAQEIVGNRIIYGNYYQNYDIPYDPKFSVAPVITDGLFKRSIKSNRNYELGVVYVDKFNRQTPVLSNNSGSYFLDKSFANKNTALSVKLNSVPPAWATHFKFFVKETSAEYYNIAADRVYFDDDNGFAFVSFPSSERNKINEDSYILLKKSHGKNEAINSPDNRYKVIDIFSEPPEFVHEKIEQVGIFGNVLFSASYGDQTLTTVKKAGSTPAKDNTTILISSINSKGTITSPPTADDEKGVDDESKKQLVVGRYVKFAKDNKKSKLYKIASIRYHLDGADEAEIKFTEPFGDDIDFLYTGTNDTIRPGIDMRIYEDSANAGDPEFNGRFFVKLESNGLLKKATEQSTLNDGDIEYYAKYSASFDGLDRNPSNVNSIRIVPFFVRWGGTPTAGSGSQNGQRQIFGGKQFHISLEVTGPADDNILLQNIETGSKIQFSNHETIYRVGQVYVQTLTSFPQIYHLRFENEDGSEQNLTETVTTNKTKLEPNFITLSLLAERDEEEKGGFVSNPAIFETEPVRQKTELDIYYENDIAYPISKHYDTHVLNWYNCFNFNNGVESNRIRDDFNAPFIKNGVKASTVLEEGYQEEHKFNGLIWSGIINSKSSINNSNQFIQAETITKDFLPSYGKIQKLHTWDNAMVIFLENKVVRVYANKSQLFDANGNGTLTSTNRVIGDAQEYNGEYGISNDPQSFAAFGFRCYFVDRKNGKVLRLSKDGLTPISDVNMNDFFRDRLATNQKIFGSFNERDEIYNISFADDNDTVSFSENVNGWVTRKSFVPQNAISINSKYFTFNNANLWKHASNLSPRNNFYGVQGESFVEFEINDEPSAVKRFKTISYEGTKDWIATVQTDQEKSAEISFINKENKYFSNIKGEAKFDSETGGNLDLKKFNFQGLGKSSEQDVIEDTRVRTNLIFGIDLTIIEASQYNAGITTQSKVLTNLLPGELIPANKNTVSLNITPPNNYKLLASDFTGTNCIFVQNGDGVTVTYTHGITYQPNIDTTILIPISGGRLILKEIEVTVTRAVVLSNCNSILNFQEFIISGRPGEVYLITNDLLTADEGFELLSGNVTISNSNINANSQISQIEGSTTEVATAEYILIENGTTSINYTVTARAKQVIIPNKIVQSKSIDTGTLENNQEQRSLRIIGEPGAIIRYVLNDSVSDIQEETLTIPSGGFVDVFLDFTATDYNIAKTYTLIFSVGEKTEFGESFGSRTVTFNRLAKSQKTLQIKAYHADSANNAIKTKSYIGFGGDEIDNDEVEFEFTLNSSYDYDIISQPSSSNFVFSNGNKNNVTISNVSISVDPVNEHIVTLNFTVDTDAINFNELVTINLDSFVNRKITLTIGYSDINQGTDYTGSFINNLSTIQGIAGSTNSSLNSIQYKILMVGKQLLDGVGEDALQPNEFRLYDALVDGNDVTETYDDNNELYLTLNDVTVGATITLQPSAFIFPNADATLYIRPSRDITEDLPVTLPNDFIVEVTGISPESELYPHEGGTQLWQKPVFRGSAISPVLWPNGHFSSRRSDVITEVSNVVNTKRLVQFVYEIDRTIIDTRSLHVSKWAPYSNNNYSLLLVNSNIIEEAASGTYTAIDGNSVTVTGPYVITNNGLTLTVNLLVDIEYVTTNSETFTSLVIRTAIDHRASSYPRSGTEGESEQFVFSTKNEACNATSDPLIWKVYNTDGKTGNPKVGSFISGNLSPVSISSNSPIKIFVPRLGQHIRVPLENRYFKDFTNSKIYKLDNRGVIEDIMDLCTSSDDSAVPIKGIINVYPLDIQRSSLGANVSDVDFDSQSQFQGITKSFFEYRIKMRFDGEYPWQVGTATEDVFFTIRLKLQDFTGQNDSFFDWFNPIHAFKVENDNNTIRSFDIVNFNDDYVDIKVTFASKNLNGIDDTFKLYVNPKKGAISPLSDRSIFNLYVDVVLDFPEETNMETNLFNPYNLGAILYRQGFGF
jgi:hypothetical protein